MDGYLGEIKFFCGNFAPQYWAFCDGRLLQISQYTALFAVISNTYGGDGKTNFALPDLRGRTAIGAGTCPGLSPRPLGFPGGTEQVAITIDSMPSHTHQIQVNLTGTATMQASNNSDATNEAGPGNYLGTGGSMPEIFRENLSNPANMPVINANISGTIVADSTGQGLPHDNMQPFLAVNYIICTDGQFPVRS